MTAPTKRSKSKYASDRERYAVRDAKRTDTIRAAKPNEISPAIVAADFEAPDVLAHIERAAASSVPPTLIAKSLGLTIVAFNKLLKDNEAMRTAYERGHAGEEMWLVNRLREIAAADSKQSVTAIAILLNGKHGFRQDKSPRIQQTQNNFFALPQPQSPDDYLRNLPAINAADTK